MSFITQQSTSLCISQAVLQQQCLEYRSQVISLRTQLDTSQTVQKDFVHLSQSLQVLDQHEVLTLLTIQSLLTINFWCILKDVLSLHDFYSDFDKTLRSATKTLSMSSSAMQFLTCHMIFCLNLLLHSCSLSHATVMRLIQWESIRQEGAWTKNNFKQKYYLYIFYYCVLCIKKVFDKKNKIKNDNSTFILNYTLCNIFTIRKNLPSNK